MEDQMLARRGMGEPTDDEVRAAFDRVIGTDVLQHSPQLSAFLRFVVEATLRGRGDRIKEYTIAVEALGRGEDFDPKVDPIVRVDAGRLRRALEQYYLGPGATDSVIIDIPRGRYVPTFRYSPIEMPAQRAHAEQGGWFVELLGAWYRWLTKILRPIQ
jgi:hypothetical protein